MEMPSACWGWGEVARGSWKINPVIKRETPWNGRPTRSGPVPQGQNSGVRQRE
jgi:hypothetical protein